MCNKDPFFKPPAREKRPLDDNAENINTALREISANLVIIMQGLQQMSQFLQTKLV